MNKWAFIRGGKVLWTATVDEPSKYFGPAVRAGLQQCPQDVEPGWHYADGSFSPPTQEEIDAEAAKDQLRERQRKIVDATQELVAILLEKNVIDQTDVARIIAAWKDA